MGMKMRGIKFTEQDWVTMTNLAQTLGLKSTSQVVQLACQTLIEQAGGQWQGGDSWGGDRIARERADVALLGLPPLADDDD